MRPAIRKFSVTVYSQQVRSLTSPFNWPMTHYDNGRSRRHSPVVSYRRWFRLNRQCTQRRQPVLDIKGSKWKMAAVSWCFGGFGGRYLLPSLQLQHCWGVDTFTAALTPRNAWVQQLTSHMFGTVPQPKRLKTYFSCVIGCTGQNTIRQLQ